jgi:molybdate transport repressor ModE-like protein
MLDLRRLRILLEISERGSISAAAEALHYTQPAVSRQVARLEEELGVDLVERTPQGVVLTDAGRLLVRHAGDVLTRAARAEEEVRALADAQSRRIALGFFPSSAPIVRAVIVAARAELPGIEISAREGEPADIEEGLAIGTLDLGLVFRDSSAPDGDGVDSGLVRTHLLDDAMHVALPVSHPLANAERVSMADLAGERWGSGRSPDHPCSAMLTRALAASGAEASIAFEADDYGAVLELVAAGAGISLVPAIAIRPERADLRFPLLDGSFARRVEIVFVDRDRRPESHFAVVDLVRSVVVGALPAEAVAP